MNPSSSSARVSYAFAARSWPRISYMCHSCASRVPFSTTAACFSKKKSRKGPLLPSSPARTRFAPSPTGYLHLGSLRTALFNYLLARRTGGQFLLRLEDTDQKRTVPGAEERLYEDLLWAGLKWDEGPVAGGPYGPYRQSERTTLYANEAQRLVETGNAYRCFCTAERLDTLARHRNSLGLPPVYDGSCSHLSAEESDERASKGEKYVVRLHVDKPYPMFDDLVFGKTGSNMNFGKEALLGNQYGDPILLKSDGHPTYHLANVVDDHYMRITHVIRGSEWIPSTPMHIALYQAFDWRHPEFAHVPLLVDKDGQKLSKRNADVDVSSYKRDVFPETLANFTALLGWSHSERSDVFSLQELEEAFNLKLTKGNTVVAFEKLWFLQKQHAQRFALSGGPQFDRLVRSVTEAATSRYRLTELSSILGQRTPEQYVSSLLKAGIKNFSTTAAFVDTNPTFFIPAAAIERPPYTHPEVQSEQTVTPLTTLHTAAATLTLLPDTHWTESAQKDNITALTTTFSPSIPTFTKSLYHYLRWALNAGHPGPGIPATLAILGRAESERRLADARRLTFTQALNEKGVKGLRVPMGEGNSCNSDSACCGGGCGSGSIDEKENGTGYESGNKERVAELDRGNA